MYKKTIIAIIVLIAFAGCKQSSSPSATKGTGPIPFVSGSWVGSNYAATFQICKVVTNYADSTSSSGEQALVSLWDSSTSVPIAGGTVDINSTALPQVNHSFDGGGINYELSTAASQTVPMVFDGSQLVFSVSGSSSFAALADTLNFVNKEMSITVPGIGDTVSKGAGFALAWSHVASSPNTVVIQIIGDSSYSENVVSDNGAFTITSAMLTGFSSGNNIEVVATRITYLDKTAPDGRNYAMASFSRVCNFYPLKP